MIQCVIRRMHIMNAIRCIIIIIVLTAQSQTILAMKALVKKQEEIAFQQQQANDAIEKERIERENKAQDDRQKAKQLHEEKEKLARAEEDRKKREQEEKRKQQELRKKAEQEEQKQQDEVRKKLEREELERTKKQEDESKRAFGIRPLIILFDPSNDDGYKGPGCGIETGAMMMTFRDALKYDIPIIADSWFLGYAQTCSEVQPDLLRWTIYTLKDKSIPVILFIPKQGIYQPYLEKLQTFSYGGATKKLSDGELLLGIKLHNFDQINALSSLAKPEKRIEDLACLKDVLITHNDLKGIGEQFGNRWDIFLTGHGGPQRTIAGMLVNDFKHFLKFLNGAIGTRSLFYDTCFAGAHLTDAYQDPVTSTEMRDIDFNFLIISATAFSKGSSANAHSNFQA